ncbi:uncharacterized protein LOC135498044 [Lineus longissimus]|uniref:uncharacterized protein LOC135498044 n=1 Tax=Lineus longissimus TaxID=88925 RepID=UPI00315DA442
MATGGKKRGQIVKELTAKELPPRNFELVSCYKTDMENSGLDPNILKSAIVDVIVKLQFALLAFAACGEWEDRNKIYYIGCDSAAVLRNIENTFFKLRLSCQNANEYSSSGYCYAADGVYDLAQKNFVLAKKEMEKCCGQSTNKLLTKIQDVCKKIKMLRTQYVNKRQEMHNDFGILIISKKETLEEERKKKDKEFEGKYEKFNSEIKKLRNKWFRKDTYTKLADYVESERSQSEKDQLASNDKFKKAIASLDIEPDEMICQDPKGRALNGAIHAFQALELYLNVLQGLLTSFQAHSENANNNEVIGLGYCGDLQSLIRKDSSRIEIITGYCRWIALGDLFQECLGRVQDHNSKLGEELMANPTQAEAQQKLKDEDWAEKRTQLLKSLEKPDRLVEPPSGYDAVVKYMQSIDETPGTDEETDDDQSTPIEPATFDHKNRIQAADIQNLGSDRGKHVRRDPGDNQPPREPLRPDTLDLLVPPGPSQVFLSAFILTLLAAAFIQWLLSKNNDVGLLT